MKRQRGRGRKPGNPANRSYESNGPEVKIRGNATQIYDKYLQLARDASSSGDRVRAENLYQHAEHYYRIIQANQPKRDPNQEENAEGAENASADGENQGGDDQPRRGRGRGRGRDRQPRDGQDPMEVVTPGGEPTEANAEGGDNSGAQADAGDDDGQSGRRRTRRPRRPRNEGEAGTEASAAEQALETASETADRESDDTGSDPSETAAA